MRIDSSSFQAALKANEKRTLFAIESYGMAAGNKMLADAKKNAPWTNRTHSARNTMSTESAWHGGRYRITLSGGVRYAVYLELVKFRHRGKLSILWPTVNKMGPAIVEAWANRIKGG